MVEDKIIQNIAKDILLKEPRYQKANMIYQFVWRFWEVSANEGRHLSALSPEAFINLNVNYGTVESIIRARRKVLEQLEKEGLLKDLTRHKMAQKHYQAYLK